MGGRPVKATNTLLAMAKREIRSTLATKSKRVRECRTRLAPSARATDEIAGIGMKGYSMATHINPITKELEPFFVQTDKRTEHFATSDAARNFMRLHCAPWQYTSSSEFIVKTNVGF